MSRRPRLCPAGIAQHVVQRGNNRQACFVADADFRAYLEWLAEAARASAVAVHAYVLMTNHVHLLVTPEADQAVSGMMQTLGRRYVRYFNHCYQRTGTLWEGRYKSALVQDHRYFLACARYIELNPVRAGMVEQPGDYSWSSFRSNAGGESSDLLTPHDEYKALGGNAEARCRAYRALFDQAVDPTTCRTIRSAVQSNLVLGNDRFKDELEALTQRRVRPAKRGRPKKRE